MMDLTKLLMPNADGPDEDQVDHGVSSIAKVDVIFRNHRRRLIDEITRHRAVVGCVAWLTDYAVLRALATCEHVSIIVQKEDFLKPDTRGSSNMLHQLYDALPGGSRHQSPYAGYSYCAGDADDSIRCVGNHNSERKPAWPRMHNKFLVFCDFEPYRSQHPNEGGYGKVAPQKVWTGSYNISDNATRSWENATLIDDATIADAYAREFGQIYGFSEALDWKSTWVEPQYRIGS